MSIELFYQILIILGIFAIRIVDVSLQALRIICISRGIRLAAALFGFFEVLVWLVAITQIMQNINSPWHYIAYALGFAMGNFVGISIERKISLGNLMIRVITNKDASELVKYLASNHYGITTADANGTTGPVQIIFTIVKRNNVDKVISIIKKFNPKAFYTVEEIRFVTDHDFLCPTPRKNIFHGFNPFFQKKK